MGWRRRVIAIAASNLRESGADLLARQAVASQAPMFARQRFCAARRGRETRKGHQQQRGHQREVEKSQDRHGTHGPYTFWRITKGAAALMLCEITTPIFPP
jgi:hypothetical protein